MRSNGIVEAYIRLLESENRIREAQLELLTNAQTTASRGRALLEHLIRQNTASARSNRQTNSMHPFGPIGSRFEPFGTSDFAVSSVTIGPPENYGTFSSLSELFRRAAAQSDQDRGERRQLSPEEIEHLTTTRTWHDGDDSGLTECPITLQPFTDGDIVRKINVCGHEFASEAIIRALSGNPTCPLCRAHVRTASQDVPSTGSNNDVGGHHHIIL